MKRNSDRNLKQIENRLKYLVVSFPLVSGEESLVIIGKSFQRHVL